MIFFEEWILILEKNYFFGHIKLWKNLQNIRKLECKQRKFHFYVKELDENSTRQGGVAHRFFGGVKNESITSFFCFVS